MMVEHAYSTFDHPLASFAQVSAKTPKRLVVFLHGWKGHADTTWGGFATEPSSSQWWSESDLLFLEYDSVHARITTTADRLRQHLPTFYPIPYQGMLVRDGLMVRADVTTPYEELYLVGHSLGGLVLRVAKLEAMTEWELRDFKDISRNDILDGILRLFSPAIAGFDPTGRLGAIMEFAPLRWIIDLYLAYGSATKELGVTSLLLAETRSRTESYGSNPDYRSLLGAAILWAENESVVKPHKYRIDVQRTAEGRDHRSVSKPEVGYILPFKFVEFGDI
ncbi:esterase/lipase family protein [Microbacterium sp. SLBN-111]|uniref:esterase/lipase family protein n=1 Tax=Microbacterium sp. SLBN-111 TaxID=3377733 RepID=UPI003C70E622